MKNKDNMHIDLENLRPKVISEKEIIEFTKDIIYLKNLKNKKFLKLTRDDADIVKLFDGERAIADILQNQLETTGTTNFQNIFSLLIELNSLEFLDKSCSRYFKDYLSVLLPEGWFLRLLKRIKRLGSVTVKELDCKCDNKVFKAIGRQCSSLGFLVILLLISITNIFFPCRLAGLNICQGFNITPAASLMTRYSFYLLTLLSLWVAFALIISLKNLLSACILTSNNCEVIHPRLVFSYGLVYFKLEKDDIVRTGVIGTIKLFFVRILFPFFIMFLLSLACTFIYPFPLIILFKQACIVIVLFSVSPLFPSDITMLLTKLKKGGVGLQHTNTFLKRRFLLTIFDFRSRINNLDYFIIVSVFNLVWLYVIIEYFWMTINTYCTFLLVDLITEGPLWGKLVILIFLLLVLVPQFVFFITALLIGVFNLSSALRTPVKRLIDMANEIKKKKVPAKGQVIEFLKQIPLFSKMDDENLGILCEHLYLKKIPKNREIIIQNERGDAFYIIVTGRVAVLKEDIIGHEKLLDILSTGDSFGDVALLGKIPQTATVRTLEHTLVFKLNRDYFDNCLCSFGMSKEDIINLVSISKTLQQIPIFSFFTPRQINSLVLRLKKRWVKKDEVICRQGDVGDYFYLIQEGEVLIEERAHGKTVFKKTIGKEDFFGEIALIKNIPRTATVTAIKRTKLLYLSKKEFFQILRFNLFAGIQIDTIAHRRLLELGKEVSKVC